MSNDPSTPSTAGGRSSEAPRRVALVDGDIAIDCHLASYRDREYPSLWHIQQETVPFTRRVSGAALLGELICGVADGLAPSPASWEVIPRLAPPDSHQNFPRLYSVWHQYERVWRISQFLGKQPAVNPQKPGPLAPGITPTLVVLDDKGHGFRDDPDWWRQYTSASLREAWFLIRSGRPLLKDAMWDEFLKTHCSRLIAVTTADDVRLSEVFVSRQLSWERTAQDLYWEVLNNEALSQFKRCAFIVVCFTASAVILFESRGEVPEGEGGAASPLRCWLVYDPHSLEEEEWRNPRNGRVQGFTYCIMAAIARALFDCVPRKPDAKDLTEVIKRGLEASRGLYRDGFEMKGEGIAFPTERVLEQIKREPTETWGVVEVPPLTQMEGGRIGDNWTILEEQARLNHTDLYTLAEEVAVRGAEVLTEEMPVYKIGKLLVADRREIEGYRSIRRLLNEYVSHKLDGAGGTRPLSIGVFGPPGSGKSFGIKQLAEYAFKGIEFKSLSFNLSQLTNPDDLRGAFHQIRDEALHGRLPLVFWDEFDSTLNRQPLGWLRYFLAPMQDGLFHEGQITHPIGRSVFIFAGGTKPTMREFQEAYSKPQDEKARRRKVPDFISRLRGYLDIRGLDPSPSADEDRLYVIRRAIVLNAQLNEHAPRSLVKGVEGVEGKQEFNIDKGVLRALLKVSEYRHGARSMEAIISTSLLTGRTRFERSCLPPTAQLDLHVPAGEFNDLLLGRSPHGADAGGEHGGRRGGAA